MAESDLESGKGKLVANQPYDESVDVNDGEEVASVYTPTPRHVPAPKSECVQSRIVVDNSSDEYEEDVSKVMSTEEKKPLQRAFVENEDEEEEDSDETDSDEDDEEHGAPPEGAYDPADYEHLPTSPEIKELFQYITRYTPQSVELDHKLKPFIPDFIPSVGDIDAFLKQQLKVKSVENAEKNPKAIDNWMESISELHRSKPHANIHYTRPMTDIETLMQEWPAEFEELLGKVSLPTAEINCDLAQYIDMICAILDIPVYKDRIQSLHVLFTLYSEFKNSQHFKALAEGNKVTGSGDPPPQSADPDSVILD
ncbi:intraflagellar transport protein 46 homolog isoform X4 [Callorhinchus milii]|uniref:intraflagellar transport protein 46 homolog isoform X4 n=1 Tax=Callorhinchus milii TaxID=7868 RepID=UPI001C3FA65D|nr:intraflagellar transport protein 46 homolog isoform X4 [Callorhinchus milii]